MLGMLLPSMVDLPADQFETTNIAMGFKSTTNSLADDVVVAAYNEIDFIVANIDVRDVPERAHHGCPFAFKLVIRDAYARTHPGAVELLRNHTRIYAHIKETRTKLAFACTPLEEDGLVGVTVCISIPPGIGFQYVVLSGIRVAGKPMLPFNFPLLRQIVPGMVAPLELAFNRSETRDVVDLAIALNGTMYVLFDAMWWEKVPQLRVFTANGTPQSSLRVPTDATEQTSLSFSVTSNFKHICIVESLDMLLISTQHQLMSFDLSRHRIRWNCFASTGFKPVVLSTQQVVVIAAGHEICAHSLTDGRLLHKKLLTSFNYVTGHPAFDELSSTVFVTVSNTHANTHQIVGLSWNGTSFIDNGIVDADCFRVIPQHHPADSVDMYRNTIWCPMHLVVVPSVSVSDTSVVTAAAAVTSYLVAFTRFNRSHHLLTVFALPVRRVVCTQALPMLVGPSIGMYNVVADPSGTAIEISDAFRNKILVLSWPLDAMRALPA